MTKLILTNHVQGNATLLENEFIDNYMPKANGEFVKVYLLLLRHLNDPSVSRDISGIADILDCTEKDVIRALNYWKNLGLLDYETMPDRDTKAKTGTVAEKMPESEAEPKTDVPHPQNITAFKNRRELKELLFVTEQYLGKTLTVTDINTITYFYDELGMSVDLIEYLIEYCVENNHKSMHYIKKVAISWAEQDIKTVSAAKNSTLLYNKNYYSVLNVYGIKGRAPAPSEAAYIRRWTEEYGLPLELILEACSRTIEAIHQPGFSYTEKILKDWMDKNVHSLQDVRLLDQEFHREKHLKKSPAIQKSASGKPSQNKFNNFEGRTYEDMDDLTRRLIQTR